MSITRDINLQALVLSSIIRGIYGFWYIIKPKLIIPKNAINQLNIFLLIISKILVIGGCFLWGLNPQIIRQSNSTQQTPIIFVVDQSRSMTHNDLTPSRRSIAQQLVLSIESITKTTNTLITYAQVPTIHSGGTIIKLLSPIRTKQGSSALGDAWLITYDHIGSGLQYKPIVITITDGGSNTGYQINQASNILKERAQLRIIGLSTGTEIVGYDDIGRGLISRMDSDTLRGLSTTGHRYAIPNNETITGITQLLIQDLSKQYYIPDPTQYSLRLFILGVILTGMICRIGIYLLYKYYNKFI